MNFNITVGDVDIRSRCNGRNAVILACFLQFFGVVDVGLFNLDLASVLKDPIKACASCSSNVWNRREPLGTSVKAIK